MRPEELVEVLERACQPVPDISTEDVLEHSVSHEPGGGPYASGVGFRVGRVGPGNSRKFLLLDKDGDGVAEYAFSYGSGPEWCMDHDDLPEDVLEHVRDVLDPLDLELDPTLETDPTRDAEPMEPTGADS